MTLWQMYELMSLPSDRFRGPYDKALWVLIMLVLPLGWLMFWIWRVNHLPSLESPAEGENERPLSQEEISAKLMLQEQRLRNLTRGNAP